MPAAIAARRRADADLHVKSGINLHAHGKAKAALAHYAQALRLRPDDGYTHYLMGLALQAIGRSAEAHDAWQRVLFLEAADEQSRWAREMSSRLLDGETHAPS